MNDELTPDQKSQLLTWAGQRDAILLEISNLQSTKENLQAINKSLSDSNTDIETRLIEYRGRIAELLTKENDLLPLISKDIADLKEEKSVLQAEITSLNKLIENLSIQKTLLDTDVSFALSTFNSVKDESLLLDKVIGHVTTISGKNVTTINNLVESVKEGMQKLIDLSNIASSNSKTIIDELPKLLVESRRQVLDRRKINKNIERPD